MAAGDALPVIGRNGLPRANQSLDYDIGDDADLALFHLRRFGQQQDILYQEAGGQHEEQSTNEDSDALSDAENALPDAQESGSESDATLTSSHHGDPDFFRLEDDSAQAAIPTAVHPGLDPGGFLADYKRQSAKFKEVSENLQQHVQKSKHSAYACLRRTTESIEDDTRGDGMSVVEAEELIVRQLHERFMLKRCEHPSASDETFADLWEFFKEFGGIVPLIGRNLKGYKQITRDMQRTLPRILCEYTFEEKATKKRKVVTAETFPKAAFPPSEWDARSSWTDVKLADIIEFHNSLHGLDPEDRLTMDFSLDGVPVNKSSGESMHILSVRFGGCRAIYPMRVHRGRLGEKPTVTEFFDTVSAYSFAQSH